MSGVEVKSEAADPTIKVKRLTLSGHSVEPLAAHAKPPVKLRLFF
jgi:hypothetical protein